MATNFPSSLDSFTNPSGTDAMDSVTVPHADQHADLNDAVEALESKVGVDGSAVTSSLDYKVNALPSNVGGSVYVYSYTLTTSDTSFISHSYTSPADNRLVSLSYTGLIEDIQAGGRIVNFKPQVSLDGGSTFNQLGHYYYWLTYDTNDALPVSFVTTFTTSSSTDIVGRVLVSKSSGTTGALYYNYLVLTDLGAA